MKLYMAMARLISLTSLASLVIPASPVAFADTHEEEWVPAPSIVPVPRGGFPGYPIPGYPSPYPAPGYPAPGYPSPYPAPYPQPSHYFQTKCESWDFRYATCYVGNAADIQVVQLDSEVACILNTTYGLSGGYIWVNHGCRATFGVIVY